MTTTFVACDRHMSITLRELLPENTQTCISVRTIAAAEVRFRCGCGKYATFHVEIKGLTNE